MDFRDDFIELYVDGSATKCLVAYKKDSIKRTLLRVFPPSVSLSTVKFFAYGRRLQVS